jgi:acetolactate synthase-1/2/3 large subunit
MILSDALVDVLRGLGVTHAFGLIGGTVAPFCQSLAHSSIHLVHFRQETGAAFAAAEASLATGRPAVVFTTSGPGLFNSLNGMMAARWDGACVILVSGTTPPAQRGRWAFQETGLQTVPAELLGPGRVFDYAVDVLDPEPLHDVASALRAGIARPQGFVAHVAVPSSVQTRTVEGWSHPAPAPPPAPRPTEGARWAKIFASDPPLVWVGFGARNAAAEVRALVEATGVGVICSPRGKGVFPEDHPLFLGVTGFAGRPDLVEVMAARPFRRILVLGSRLGEFTSSWDRALFPPDGIVHVDVDPDVPGTALPEVPTEAVCAEIGAFLRDVLSHWPDRAPRPRRDESARRPVFEPQRDAGPVRPPAVMEALQRLVVDATDVPLLVDCGNAAAWAVALLRLRTPARLRVSTRWGSMGHACAGVVGVALGTGRKAIALVGDGALLLQNEISTAVQYGAGAIWVVFNDAQYGMIEHGMRQVGMVPFATQIPTVDFVALARSLGADGIAVRREVDLDDALERALSATGPFMVDVTIDREMFAPIGRRVGKLLEQGVKGR